LVGLKIMNDGEEFRAMDYKIVKKEAK
jgi:hypothetical protein